MKCLEMLLKVDDNVQKKVPLSRQLLARALPRGPPTGLKATVDRKVYLWSCGIPWCRLTSIYFISFFSFFSFFYIHFMIVNLLFIHHLPFILIIWYLSYRVTQSTIINMKKIIIKIMFVTIFSTRNAYETGNG